MVRSPAIVTGPLPRGAKGGADRARARRAPGVAGPRPLPDGRAPSGRRMTRRARRVGSRVSTDLTHPGPGPGAAGDERHPPAPTTRSGLAAEPPRAGPQPRPDHREHGGRPERAGVGRTVVVVTEDPPAVLGGPGGPLHRQLARPVRPPDQHDVPGLHLRAEPHEHHVAVPQRRRHRRSTDGHPPPAHVHPLITLLRPDAGSSVEHARTITIQGGPMRLFARILRPRLEATAHCDLPCGVYDPAQARIEAESVKAIQEKYQGNEDPEFRTRALKIKEQRADLVKHHLWVLWTDYFKPP